ncbi:hypothetical protein C8039_07945 [Halogeometricum sp. wsp3]|nr:hypothetical protein C8039_07945 [Halogeometricum sp. wsp3]
MRTNSNGTRTSSRRSTTACTPSIRRVLRVRQSGDDRPDGLLRGRAAGSYTGFIKNDGVVERAESIVQEMIFEDRDDEETFELSIRRRREGRSLRDP